MYQKIKDTDHQRERLSIGEGVYMLFCRSRVMCCSERTDLFLMILLVFKLVGTMCISRRKQRVAERGALCNNHDCCAVHVTVPSYCLVSHNGSCGVHIFDPEVRVYTFVSIKFCREAFGLVIIFSNIKWSFLEMFLFQRGLNHALTPQFVETFF